MKSKHFSLEERVVEPFHSIRWIFISRLTAILSVFALLLFDFGWWFFHENIFNFWKLVLEKFVSAISETWIVQSGVWPDTSHVVVTLPELSVPVLAPNPTVWWSYTLATIAIWVGVGYLKTSLLPIRTITRFMVFLIWISLGCFAIAPLQFHHSVDEWSKVFFLSAFGGMFIYSAIWNFGVLWLPIPLRVKFLVSALLAGYLILGPPVIFFTSVIVLAHSSLILLPFFALFVVPILQLGWFVAFYSIALSSGPDGLARLEAAT